MLTKYNGQSITYDAIGNPTAYRDGITMEWQHGRELKTFKKGDTTINFTYDPGGLRTRKAVEGLLTTDYVYEGGKLMQMKHSTKLFDFFYDSSGTAIGFAYRSTASATPAYYYYGINSRGDVEVLYNSAGSVVAKYKYDAYGKLLSIKNSAGAVINDPNSVATLNPLRYRGYVYDTETGFYYLQSRYYDPTTCRFINADGIVSTGQDICGNNMFVYCGNNPVIRADDSGEFWHIVAGAAIGFGVSFVSTLLTGGTVEDALISGAFGMVSGAVTAACPAAGVWVDMGLAAVESVVLDCKNADENTTAMEIVTNAAVSVGFASLPCDDFFGSKAFSNEVSQLANVVSTMSKNADAPIKSAVGNYTKKWGKEAMFACETYINKAAAQVTTQEFTKVCVRLMVKEGLL